jgi:hypothetical protein
VASLISTFVSQAIDSDFLIGKLGGSITLSGRTPLIDMESQLSAAPLGLELEIEGRWDSETMRAVFRARSKKTEDTWAWLEKAGFIPDEMPGPRLRGEISIIGEVEGIPATPRWTAAVSSAGLEVWEEPIHLSVDLDGDLSKASLGRLRIDIALENLDFGLLFLEDLGEYPKPNLILSTRDSIEMTQLALEGLRGSGEISELALKVQETEVRNPQLASWLLGDSSFSIPGASTRGRRDEHTAKFGPCPVRGRARLAGNHPGHNGSRAFQSISPAFGNGDLGNE